MHDAVRTCARGNIMPGAGPPTPRAGPAKPAAAPPGAGMAMPRPATFARPLPAAAFFALRGCCSSAGGGPSSTSDTISSPLRMTRPSTRRSSRCTPALRVSTSTMSARALSALLCSSWQEMPMHCMFDRWGLRSARPAALHASRCRAHLVLALLRWQLAQLLRVAKDHVEMLVEGHEPAASRHIISQACRGAHA